MPPGCCPTSSWPSTPATISGWWCCSGWAQPDLDRSFEPDHLTSLFLPDVAEPAAGSIQRSVDLMHRLRHDCPWDAEQTHGSLRRYLLEETYEVMEAIESLQSNQRPPLALAALFSDLGARG